MPYRYLLFYKPYQVLSQFRAPDAQKSTLKDYIPVKGVYPVGRLDYDSEGLMLLSDHGQLQHRLSHPRYGHPRTYWVQVEHLPAADALEHLRRGIMIQGKLTQPAQVRRLLQEPQLPARHPPIRVRKTVPTAWIEITLREGRNRQVRRMTAAVGHPTLRLVRVAIAHLQLASLSPGEWRFLTHREQASLLALFRAQSR